MGNCDSKPLCETPSDKILIQQIEDHSGGINCLVQSEDGSLLATGGDDSTVRLYGINCDCLECLGMLQGHKDIVTAMCIVDSYLLSVSADKTLRKWDLSNCEQLYKVDAHAGPIHRLVFASELEAAITCSADGLVKLFAYRNGKQLACFSGHSRSVSCVLYVARDELEASRSNSGLKAGSSKQLRRGLVVSGSGDRSIKAWSVADKRLLHSMEGHQDTVTCLDFDPSCHVLYSGSADRSIRAWRLADGQQLRVFFGHNSMITCIKASKKLLYSAGADSTARAWAAEFGDCMRVFDGHSRSINSIYLFQGVLFTACGDGLIRAFCARSARLIRVFEGHQYSVIALLATQDRLFSVGYDGKLVVWHLEEVFEKSKGKK